MGKNVRVAALLALLLAIGGVLAGCGASLDREVVVQGMTLKVPSGWLEVTGEENDESVGTMRYVDTDEDENNAVVIAYDLRPENMGETAEQDIMAKRAWAEGELGATEWEDEEVRSMVIDGAQASVYEYSFEKEIDNISRTYEYAVAYVYSETEHYQIRVIGSAASLDAVVDSVELA